MTVKRHTFNDIEAVYTVYTIKFIHFSLFSLHFMIFVDEQSDVKIQINAPSLSTACIHIHILRSESCSRHSQRGERDPRIHSHSAHTLVCLRWFACF